MTNNKNTLKTANPVMTKVEAAAAIVSAAIVLEREWRDTQIGSRSDVNDTHYSRAINKFRRSIMQYELASAVSDVPAKQENDDVPGQLYFTDLAAR